MDMAEMVSGSNGSGGLVNGDKWHHNSYDAQVTRFLPASLAW